MRKLRAVSSISAVCLFLGLVFSPRANEAPRPIEATLFARTDKGVIAFSLERTSVDVRIDGVMSHVRVRQTFKNPLDRAIEATYVFPLPAHAAVHAMTMRVGERRIVAEVQRRADARHTYENARDNGQTASLLEEERENVFTQSVANVLPNDAIEVELAYTQELVPVDGEYELVYPMVVAPRYVPAGVKDASRISAPVLPKGVRPGNDITMHVWMETGMPIASLYSPTHDVEIRTPRVGTAVVDLRANDRIPNRDFALRYRLAGEHPRAAVLTGKDAHGGHLLMMVQPAADLRSKDAAPREYTFVLDISGSMNGQPHERAKRAMELLLADLRPHDLVQVILFESGVHAAFPSAQPATADNVHAALAFVETSPSGGGTEVLPALTAAVEAKRTPGTAREIAILTDGEIGNEDEILRYLTAHRKGMNVFAVGVGSSVNRAFIDALGRVGHGESFVMLPDDDAKAITKRLFQLMSRPSLTDVTIDWGGLPVHDTVPAQPPDLFADRPIVVGAKFDHAATGTITVRGRLAGKPYEEKLEVSLPAAQTEDASLAYLWARRRVTELSDVRPRDEKQMKGIEQQITTLGLDYHLVTPYTSFVAVDERVRTHDKALHVTQSVPLPPDVAVETSYARLSNYSVRGGDPEIEIRAPRGVRAVSVVLPDGEMKRCFFDRERARWIGSFLLPVDLHEGVYVLSIVLEHAEGTTQLRRVRIQVDEQPPEIAVELERTRVRPGESVRLTARSVGRATRVTTVDEDIGDPDFAAHVESDTDEMFLITPASRTLVFLDPVRPREFSTTIVAPMAPGRYSIPVLARDGARNGARAAVELEVVAP